MKIKKQTLFLLLLGCCLFILANVVYHYRLFDPGPATLIQKVEKELHEKEALLLEAIQELEGASNPTEYFTVHVDKLNQLSKKENIALFLYINDSLKSWSSNSVPDPKVREKRTEREVLQLENGWYELIAKKHNNITIVGSILIKNQYPYENKYLKNSFFNNISLPDNAQILLEENKDAFPVRNNKGEPLFYLDIPLSESHSNKTSFIATILYLAGVALFLLVLRSSIGKAAGKWGWLFFLFLLYPLRDTMLFFKFPEALYATELFSPVHYASSGFFPSLGDFLINAFLLFYTAFLLNRHVRFPVGMLKKLNLPGKAVLATLLFLLVFILSNICEEMIEGLIENSNISFNINNLFELSVYSYIAIVIIGILLFSYFLLVDLVVSLVISLGLKKRYFGIVLCFAAVLFIVGRHLFVSPGLIAAFLPLALVSIISILKKNRKTYHFAGIVIIVSVFSLFSAYILSKYSLKKEHKERKILVEKLSVDEDPVAELIFKEMDEQMLQDTLFNQIYGSEVAFDEVKKKIAQKYFSGYLSRFHFEYFRERKDSTLSAKGEYQRIKKTLGAHGRKTISQILYYIDHPAAKESYIIKIPAKENNSSFFIALENKFIPEQIGFPELLLDREAGIFRQLSDYSYAKYNKGKLIHQFGEFAYPLTPVSFEATGESAGANFTPLKGYDHLVFPGLGKVTIISKKEKGWIDRVTVFSYMFAFFSIILLISLLLKNLSSGINFRHLSFNSKIQFLLTTVIFISLLLFGWGTMYYIKKQYRQKNYDHIDEKIRSVLIEVEGKLSDKKSIASADKEYMGYIMKKFSSVFFTDITLFDPEGNLVVTSRPKLFEEGLLSGKMDPVAYKNLKREQMSGFIHEEQVGKMKYLSAYAPFINRDGKLLAYLNLPYFAKQNELETEISSFLVALINIYVFLFALSLVATIFISNLVTQPLRLIQGMLAKIQLGKTNQPIAYEGKDEIGRLVEIYNEKVNELQKSAELLAKSERESAWREMARQVAHEIKNPLTPMKLSVQHLERSWKDQPENWEERLQRFTKTITEQIDTLSNIAGEFSNFAKMPLPKNRQVDLKELIQSAVVLYKNHPGIDISFNEDDCKGAAIVMADSDHLLRLFNNLLKNAIQAIPEKREGSILICLKRKKGELLIEIEDNGSGIPEEMVDKIFSPSFTTKSGGTGLGLAMVKNIVENANGKIWFETEEGQGTTFFVTIPAYQ